MKCQKCQVREATNHMTEVINGKKQELHLCSKCVASAPEFHNIDFGIGNFLGGIFNAGKMKHPHQDSNLLVSVCPDCGMPFDSFVKKGRLGCGTCYKTFRSLLEGPLKRIHGTCDHVGKIPSRMGGAIRLDRQVAQLEEELNSAVMKQEFEKAAKIRDRIIELKQQNQEEA